MRIKLDLGEIDVWEIPTWIFYAFVAWLFIEPLGMGLYVMGLILVPLLFLNAAYEVFTAWQRKRADVSDRAWQEGDYDAATDMERRIAKSEIYYPEY